MSKPLRTCYLGPTSVSLHLGSIHSPHPSPCHQPLACLAWFVCSFLWRLVAWVFICFSKVDFVFSSCVTLTNVMEMPSKTFCWGTLRVSMKARCENADHRHRPWPLHWKPSAPAALGYTPLLPAPQQQLAMDFPTLPHPGFHKAAGENQRWPNGMTHPKVMIACMHICLYNCCLYIFFFFFSIRALRTKPACFKAKKQAPRAHLAKFAWSLAKTVAGNHD